MSWDVLNTAFMPEITSPQPVVIPTLAYRLVKERFSDTPLSSEGARRYGGRWNPAGIGIFYTSSSPELALLEDILMHAQKLKVFTSDTSQPAFDFRC